MIRLKKELPFWVEFCLFVIVLFTSIIILKLIGRV